MQLRHVLVQALGDLQQLRVLSAHADVGRALCDWVGGRIIDRLQAASTCRSATARCELAPPSYLQGFAAMTCSTALHMSSYFCWKDGRSMPLCFEPHCLLSHPQ